MWILRAGMEKLVRTLEGNFKALGQKWDETGMDVESNWEGQRVRLWVELGLQWDETVMDVK